MPRNHRPLGLLGLISAGLRRSRWQTAAGLLAGLIATGALVAALGLLNGMQHLLEQGLDSLGGDLVLVQPGHKEAVVQWLQGEEVDPIPATIDVSDWREKLKKGRVLGLLSSEGIDLSEGGRGEPGFPQASMLVLRLEFWAAPMMMMVELEEILPEAEVVVGEQTTRHVLNDLQPLVRHLSTAAGVALFAAVLISGLLAGIRTGERRAELGMLRAVGATRRFLIGLTLGESLVLALVGGGLGALFALLALWLVPASGGLLRYLPLGELLKLTGLSLGGTSLAAAVASLGPALRTASLDPLDAVRRHG